MSTFHCQDVQALHYIAQQKLQHCDVGLTHESRGLLQVRNYGTMPQFQRMSNRKDHSKCRNVAQNTIQWPNFDLKKKVFCPKRCTFGGPSRAVEFVEEAGARDMDTVQPDGSASGSWAQIRPLGAAKRPPGPQKRHFLAKTDPFWGPRSSVEVSEGAQAHGMDAAHPAGPTSGSWAKNRPTGPSEDL